MHGLCSKLVCLSKLVSLSKPVKVTENRKYNISIKICLFSVNYHSVMFYSTCPKTATAADEVAGVFASNFARVNDP